MSWDVTLFAVPSGTEGPEIAWFNYTHNTSPMIYDALEGTGILGDDESWWEHLDGRQGGEGQVFLTKIIEGLEADPDRYRAMNPANGWGNYDGLLQELREMAALVSAEDTAHFWSASG